MPTRRRNTKARRGLPAGVSRHGDGYRADITVRGKRVKSAVLPTAEEAGSEAERLRASLRDWKPGQRPFTLRDGFDLVRANLRRRKKAAATVEFYERQFRTLLTIFDGEAPLARIGRREIQRFMDIRAEHVASRTVQANVATLRRILNLAMKDPATGIRENPVKYVEMPSPDSRRFDHLEPNELQAHLARYREMAAAPNCRWQRGEWDANVFEFLAITGLRARGFARLRVDECNPFKGTISVASKTGQRTVSLSCRAVALLRELIRIAQTAGTEFIVGGDTENRRAARVTESTQRIKRRLGAKWHGGTHVARHTFGTAVARVPEVNAFDVMNALGDKTMAAAQRYVHEHGKRTREIVDLASEILANNDTGKRRRAAGGE